jgi:hypothetical protein
MPEYRSFNTYSVVTWFHNRLDITNKYNNSYLFFYILYSSPYSRQSHVQFYSGMRRSPSESNGKLTDV